jgi:hypothetical protein
MTPNVASLVDILVDVELENLGSLKIGAIEIHVINEVSQGRNERLARVWEALSRESANQVIVP